MTGKVVGTYVGSIKPHPPTPIGGGGGVITQHEREKRRLHNDRRMLEEALEIAALDRKNAALAVELHLIQEETQGNLARVSQLQQLRWCELCHCLLNRVENGRIIAVNTNAKVCHGNIGNQDCVRRQKAAQ